MEKKVKLTKAVIEALQPEAKDRLVRDAELSGFGVRVTKTGSKSYFVERKVAGVTKRKTISRVEFMSVKDAREEGLRLLSSMAQGVVPEDPPEPPPQKPATTLREVLSDYLAERQRRSPPMKAKTAQDYRKRLESELSDWLELPPSAITKKDVADRFLAISERGPTLANSVFRIFRAIMNHAIDNESFTGPNGEPALLVNPVAILKKRRLWNEERRKTRTLSPETLPAWWAMVEAMDPLDWPERAHVLRDLWKLMLLTGMRYEEASRIELDLLDLEQGNIHVEDSKNRQDINLPVGAYTLAMLQARAEDSRKRGSKWLFPAPKRDHTAAGHDVRYLLTAKHGIEWSPHDLRRTFATTLDTFGLSENTIKRLMGHKQADVTAGYIQHDTPYLRAVMQRYEVHILSLCCPASKPKRRTSGSTPARRA